MCVCVSVCETGAVCDFWDHPWSTPIRLKYQVRLLLEHLTTSHLISFSEMTRGPTSEVRPRTPRV